MRNRRTRSLSESGSEYEFHPGKTAMKRKVKDGFRMPTSVTAAMKDRTIRRGISVFDYGEGLGETCEHLRKHYGVDCRGWDKFHSGHKPKISSDVVTLNFVLNVVPDPVERAKALREAHRLAREALVVGVRGRSDERSTKSKTPWGDGYRVRKSGAWTFQKFYTPDQAVQYVRDTLGSSVKVRVLKSDPVVLVVDKGRR